MAAAVRFLFKWQAIGSGEFTRTNQARQDIGAPSILEFLEGVPGVNNNTVREQLANLKKSGNYARILEEAQTEVDAQLRADQVCIGRHSCAVTCVCSVLIARELQGKDQIPLPPPGRPVPAPLWVPPQPLITPRDLEMANVCM